MLGRCDEDDRASQKTTPQPTKKIQKPLPLQIKCISRVASEYSHPVGPDEPDVGHHSGGSTIVSGVYYLSDCLNGV